MLRMINVLYNLHHIYHVLGQSWLLQITNIFPQLFLIPEEQDQVNLTLVLAPHWGHELSP